MTNQLTAQRPRRRPGSSLRKVEHGAVLHTVAPEGMVVLNPTALALWELCDGHTLVEEMVAAVCDLFAVTEERARADVHRALADMRSRGAIT